jgi:preprotein translocase subunit SecA
MAAIRSALGQAAPDVAVLRAELRRDGWRGAALHRACGTVHRAAVATLGHEPFDTQWLAALALLDGRLAEMATGEGKTLALALAACVTALAGRRVHVITANDYLVERDADVLRPLFAHCGIEVGSVVGASDARAREAAYRRQVVYVTARELVFDSLRDAQAVGGTLPLQRQARALAGVPPVRRMLPVLDVAFIDEADSILLDEAQMPLILSRPAHDMREATALADALGFARGLQADLHFEPGIGPCRRRLTAAGEHRLQRWAGENRSVWLHPDERTEFVERALTALHGLQRDRDYLVRDEQVVLIDAVTGRTAPGRVWGQGLHELVALKEGCAVPTRAEPVAKTTYPRFFLRYRHLAGTSGTLVDAARELKRLYGLKVLTVPLRCPSRRRVLPGRSFDCPAVLWHAAALRALELAAQGRAVLIGTDSVADACEVARHLRDAGADLALLNAAQDAQEARVVAEAGRAGRITVATNMAGRGTDIVLADSVRQAGGLHVLSCQRNPSRRHDLQLAGRCARQGDPGSVEQWTSWPAAPRVWFLCAVFRRRAADNSIGVWSWVAALAARWRQSAAESLAARERRRLIEIDRLDQERLHFALPAE